MTGILLLIFMTLKRIYRRGDYEALNQNFANKARTATEAKHGI
jgi:hypothetical protein